MGMMMLLTVEVSALEFCYINMTDQYINIVLKKYIWPRNKKYSYKDILHSSLQGQENYIKT